MMIRSDIPRRFFTKTEAAGHRGGHRGRPKRCTTGEIRIFIERDVEGAGGDPYLRAREVFAQLGMHEHRRAQRGAGLPGRALAAVRHRGRRGTAPAAWVRTTGPIFATSWRPTSAPSASSRAWWRPSRPSAKAWAATSRRGSTTSTNCPTISPIEQAPRGYSYLRSLWSTQPSSCRPAGSWWVQCSTPPRSFHSY